MSRNDFKKSVKRISFVTLFLALCFGMASSANAQSTPLDIVSDDERSLPVFDFEGLKPMLAFRNDTTYVINFWATWCAPCVKELPYFEELNRSTAENGKALRVILVSLDFPRQLQSRLLPFLKDRDITSTVVVLDDPDANSWIDQVDPSWSGAIPGTLIYRGERREFREQSFSRDELFQLVNTFME